MGPLPRPPYDRRVEGEESRSAQEAGPTSRAGAEWELLRAYAAGDRRAFAGFVERHERFVQHLVLRYLRDRPRRELADEIVQETWYQVLRRLREGGLPDPQPVTKWIGGICLNVLRTPAFRIESPGAREPGRDEAAHGVEEADPAEAVAAAELAAALSHCADALPSRLREVYDLVYEREATYVAAAAALGCSEANVRTRLVPHLRELLRRCLAHRGVEVPRDPEGSSIS